ncbi:MAG TPA: hypothetical protein VEC99_17395, partial [Clostridia bacterium]|nr:hypothetical protein [Clostridia bacterium]
MKHRKTFAAFFLVLLLVSFIHTSSNLWMVFPDNMPGKNNTSTLDPILGSGLLAVVYTIGGVGFTALLARFCWSDANAESGALANRDSDDEQNG